MPGYGIRSEPPCQPWRQAASITIAPYPKRVAWYAQIDPDQYVFVDPPEACFVAETEWLRA